ncbi:MAG: dTDP-glucose 4,6-dehydratase [bacterium]|nr:dTDP-glucose 4,6-dehydratase [bacterium]
MNLLVTGGCGFIGSNFIRYELEKHSSISIVNLDKLTYAGNLENLLDIHKKHKDRYVFVKGDILDAELVKQIIAENRVDIIVNFAAESHVDRSIRDSSEFMKTNILGVQTLLDIAKQAGIKRFIQISTDEVYGDLPGEGYFREETPLAPNSPYAASKASADMLVGAYFHTYQLPVIITRCSNNYGPYQFPEKFIPLIIINALQSKALPIYGDGTNVRDWIHVKDHCSAIDLVLQRGEIGEIYNIGANNERTNIDIAKFVLKRLGKTETLIKFVKDRLGHDRRYAINADKIKKALGWKPVYDFEDGLKQTISWYIKNENWWKSIIGL